MPNVKTSLCAIALALELTVVVTGQSQNPLPATAPPPGLTIKVLDSLTRLPGGLSALPAPPIPADNVQTEAKIELGRMLFFDKRLSLDRSTSCASCHDPDKAYSDDRARAVGIGHTILSRRAPSLLNGAYNSAQFWDGRARSLEEQALAPMLSTTEMGMPGPKALVERLQGVPEYSRRFHFVFGRAVNLRDIQRAIAAFERTLVTPDAAFDRYVKGDKQALTDQQKRGLILFIGKASCSQCHSGPNFTDNKFHSLGLLPGQTDDVDLGHFVVSRKLADRHAFKTPSLRSSTDQSRFMHNGAIATLADVIEFYDQGGGRGVRSSLLFKLQLTAGEKGDLLAFLHALAGRVPDDSHLTGGK
jgi:cytochrome c peroxidase